MFITHLSLGGEGREEMRRWAIFSSDLSYYLDKEY